MGFETNKRIIKSMNNTRVRATVGGQKCYFRSKYEYRWAQYLELLKQQGQIKSWSYEPETFHFIGEKTAPVQYTPDFKVIENDGNPVYHEMKGYHDGCTNKKLQRLVKHYSGTVIELYLQGKGKANRKATAEKYCRRVADGEEILRQLGGLIRDMPPIID